MQKIQQEYLVKGKEVVVTLDYENNQRMSNLVVLYDGKNVGYFVDVAGAKDGVSLIVPDLGKIDIRINTGMFSKPKIFLTVNGHVERPVKKKPTQAELSNHEKWTKSVQQGTGVLYFISGISIIGSVVAILFQVQFLLQMGMGGISICAGLIFLGLGYASSTISWEGFGALVVATLLYMADSALTVYINGGSSSMFVRVFFTIALLQAIYACWKLLTTPDTTDTPFVKVPSLK